MFITEFEGKNHLLNLWSRVVNSKGFFVAKAVYVFILKFSDIQHIHNQKKKNGLFHKTFNQHLLQLKSYVLASLRYFL